MLESHKTDEEEKQICTFEVSLFYHSEASD